MAEKEWLFSKKESGISAKPSFFAVCIDFIRGGSREIIPFRGSIPTGFPIPIVLRKSLEQKGKEKDGNLLAFPGIRFYVLFNENLLNEEKLQQLALEKQREIDKKQELIDIRRKEYESYFQWERAGEKPTGLPRKVSGKSTEA